MGAGHRRIHSNIVLSSTATTLLVKDNASIPLQAENYADKENNVATNYPEHREHIQGLVERLSKDISNTMAGFGQLHRAATAQGALSPKDKELIALGIAIALRCDGCIAYHVHDAIKAGATREEMVETIGVAILMGGGPSLMYGAETYEAIEQFMGSKA